jgi:ATP/maltotriose-dependent transcriptional regulator MalT
MKFKRIMPARCLLSERELHVLKLYIRFDKKEIAHILNISIDTVKAHLKHCTTKLHARHVRQAMYMAMRMGLF